MYPEEVDEVVKTMPDVDDCLVFGVADETYGQVVHTVVQPAAGVTVAPEAVTQWVRERLARYKAPRVVHVVTKVPRLPNGKPDYPGAREVAQRDGAAQGAQRDGAAQGAQRDGAAQGAQRDGAAQGAQRDGAAQRAER